MFALMYIQVGSIMAELNVRDTCSVEVLVLGLFDYDDPVVELLPLEDGMHVVKKHFQMFLPIPRRL
jgi:hypothetical protein